MSAAAIVHGVLIASCPVPETSTIDTCPYDNNTTHQDNNITISRTTHYNGAEPFCSIPIHGKRRVNRGPNEFDSIHEYILWNSQASMSEIIKVRQRKKLSVPQIEHKIIKSQHNNNLVTKTR